MNNLEKISSPHLCSKFADYCHSTQNIRLKHTKNSKSKPSREILNYLSNPFEYIKDFEPDLGSFNTRPSAISDCVMTREEIVNLKNYIKLLQKQLAESEELNKKYAQTIKDPKKYHKAETRILDMLEVDNKKLKEKIKSSETTVERLYNEIKILNEQLLISQKRLESYSLNKFSIDPSVFTSIIEAIQEDLHKKCDEQQIKIQNLEKRLKKTLETQEGLKKIVKNPNLSLSSSKLKKQTENLTQKICDYENEIKNLNSTIITHKEKYNAFKLENDEKTQKMMKENKDLKDLIESTQRQKALESISKYSAKSKIPFPSISFGKPRRNTNENYIKDKGNLAEIYNVKIDQLETEIKILQKDKEILSKKLVENQEALRITEEELIKTQKIMEKTSNLKGAGKKYTDFILQPSNKEKQREDKLEIESFENLKTKYSRLLIDFNVNKKALDAYQNEIANYKVTIQEQKDIIESLKLNFNSHGTQKSLQKKVLPKKTKNQKSLILEICDYEDQKLDTEPSNTISNSKNHISYKPQVLPVSNSFENLLQEHENESKNYIEPYLDKKINAMPRN